jgi:hypothetical protein
MKNSSKLFAICQVDCHQDISKDRNFMCNWKNYNCNLFVTCLQVVKSFALNWFEQAVRLYQTSMCLIKHFYIII